MSEAASRRLNKELQVFNKSPPQNITCGPVADDLLHWQATLAGPADTPYAGGIFSLDLKFKGDYPFKPPDIKFLTKIYHPNVDDDGSICLPLIKPESWKPATKVLEILQEISLLLTTPNPEDPLRAAIAEQFMQDYEGFKRTATEWTRKHAM